MDWDKLKIFHAVTQAGSFTKAGDVLNLSQSAISRQIQSLEYELKCSLFQRHARGLSLTENGETLYKTANEVISLGIEYIKIGLFSESQIINHEKFLKEIDLTECKPVCVILIDDAKDIHYLDRISEIGYRGVMLDTINKKQSRVFDKLSEKECVSFVRESRKLGMTSGLAGSLTLGDLPKLRKINSDFIGFRGQLCEKQSNRFSLDRSAVIKLLGSTHLSTQRV